MLKKRLLLFTALISNVIGLTPAVLFADQPASASQEVCFEFAKEQYKDYFSPGAQELMANIDELCRSHPQEFQQKICANFAFSIWSAFFKLKYEGYKTIKNIVVDYRKIIDFDQNSVLFSNQFMPRAVSNTTILSFFAGCAGFFFAYNTHQGDELAAFRERLAAFKKADMNYNNHSTLQRSNYHLELNKLCSLIKKIEGRNDINTIPYYAKGEGLKKIETKIQQNSADQEWRSSIFKFTGLVLGVAAAMYCFKMIDNDIKERSNKRAFETFMKKPDACVLLAQKFNEFYERVSRESHKPNSYQSSGDNGARYS